ncbi:branched-chain amino acid transport system carrier protein [Photobacterium aphoticum]|uniref:Branched-chain amino acid transport system carrier protein n=1 Tax=Photobacterium aphoticum TaxID=754436 RepID=A0A090QZI7_9GAMM|nr:branched-chain amino acid transport system carrier protein [Photobacterium aphoticum]
MLLLGAVMVLACLTTAIGVTTAGSEFYSRTFKAVTYRRSVWATMLVAGLVANVGLDQLLAITLPAVVALHPIAISLLLIAPLRQRLNTPAVLTVLATALLFGGIDALHILGAMPAAVEPFFTQYLPLYGYYAGWVVPTLVVLAASTVVCAVSGKQAKTCAAHAVDVA